MSRLFIVIAAAAFAFVMPEAPSAEACGVKMSVKGARVRQARASLETRRAKGSSQERTPRAVGPIQVSARGRISGGGGGGDTQPAPAKSVESGAKAPVATAPKPKKKKPARKPAPVVAENKESTSEPTPSTEPTPVDSTPSDAGDKGAFHKEYSFENGSATLGDEQRSNLTATAAWLKAHPKKRLVVEGHASRVGAADTNQAISEARAQAVIDYLVAEGVPAKRLTRRAQGAKKPAYKPASDPRNRRVMLYAK